jgi:NitT/TauT family transport system substrate-binding protein
MAKDKLASDPASWERLKPMMKVKSDDEFAELKAGFLAGIPSPGPVDEAAAARMLSLMVELGGADLVGDLKVLPHGVFYQPGS